MCDDDSFNIATVPRHAKFGSKTDSGDGDDESTLGDRFFDLLSLQRDTISKADLSHCIQLRDECKLASSNIEKQFDQLPTAGAAVTSAITDTVRVTAVNTLNTSAGNIHDDASFGLNRLAMFRHPSRTRSSGFRSNVILREDNNTPHLSTFTVELSCNENSGPNGCAEKKEAVNRASKISSSGPSKPMKTLRYSASHATQTRQQSLDKGGGRVQPAEMKQRMGSVKCQPTIKIRASSAEPRTQRLAVDFKRARKATETTVLTQPRGLLRVRSSSSSAARTRNVATNAANAVRTNQITISQRQNEANLTTRTGTNTENTVPKLGATKKLPYVGPETRARAKIKQSNENLKVMRISSTVSTPKQLMIIKPEHNRPLSQLNSNISRNASGNGTALVSNTKSAESGHVSRSRTREAHEPVRVRNTQGRVKGANGLPPIESESRFRQSLTRRPKGGDSLDRDVTKAVGKENDEIWTVVTKKPEPVLEFASCLRSRVAAKKVQSTSTHFTGLPNTGQTKQDARKAPRRRTEAEREAFYRRLSTPKTVATIKKSTK
ncbi:Uncharacterized protein BM_BM9827 [Brugia malayi]|uniref:Bm9827 n=2 Tax=Brugia malayi TaxID=6279 RepID=A0A4E9FE14_BRUMA|nr:Uncharacterized protein BM_BM9827 [Brugia malayi]VIO94464.1 Uncharacterized protein BM_BM9827 [Brugia malayi]